LRVDPKKKMVFNPEESIDFHGFTGPFIQYTHARIKSILRKTRENTCMDRSLCKQEPFAFGKRTGHTAGNVPFCFEDAAAMNTIHRKWLFMCLIYQNFQLILYRTFDRQCRKRREKNTPSYNWRSYRAGDQNGMNVLGIRVPERM
jgi:arginyl-tRNA synthetase